MPSLPTSWHEGSIHFEKVLTEILHRINQSSLFNQLSTGIREAALAIAVQFHTE